jgi:hypothetical protein
MKNYIENNITFLTLIIFCFVFLFNVRSNAQSEKTIEIDELSVIFPGLDWKLKIDTTKKNEVTIYKEKKSIVKLVGYSLIKISKDSIREDIENFTESDISDSIFRKELKLLYKESKPGSFEISDTCISKETLFGKEFFLLSFKSKLFKKTNLEGENVLFIFFPPDFKEIRVLYKFLVNEYLFENTLLETNDTKIIYPILKSIKINNIK